MYRTIIDKVKRALGYKYKWSTRNGSLVFYSKKHKATPTCTLEQVKWNTSYQLSVVFHWYRFVNKKNLLSWKEKKIALSKIFREDREKPRFYTLKLKTKKDEN